MAPHRRHRRDHCPYAHDGDGPACGTEPCPTLREGACPAQALNRRGDRCYRCTDTDPRSPRYLRRMGPAWCFNGACDLTPAIIAINSAHDKTGESHSDPRRDAAALAVAAEVSRPRRALAAAEARCAYWSTLSPEELADAERWDATLPFERPPGPDPTAVRIEVVGAHRDLLNGTAPFRFYVPVGPAPGGRSNDTGELLPQLNPDLTGSNYRGMPMIERVARSMTREQNNAGPGHGPALHFKGANLVTSDYTPLADKGEHHIGVT